MIPLRVALERSGLKATWERSGQIVKAEGKDMVIEFQVGASEALVNDHVVVLPKAIKMENGQAVVPPGLVADLLKAEGR